ncbi:MAG: Ca2+-transporting ATPase [Candidatus Berkelbacteria bacterium Athens1014_28]|uniref:Ca2+-transporting ATPase n=1 Tax=Candidatus Berkelbacteria bacterium Athens1014_28 TaxID=2017145 RepID=A0A554LLW3_9BACT|nr:MAG: Ca2+-transporting ATPase [Candidatus Berkelbacteria bacterium Athens1014_28]
MTNNFKSPKQPCHALELSEIIEKFDSSENGLSSSVAKSRLKSNPNVLPKEQPFSAINLLVKQLKSPFNLTLFFACFLTFLLGDRLDFSIILVAFSTSMIFGFFQEHKTAKVIKAIKDFVQPKAIVLRDGKQKQIDQSDIVVGDVIILNTGDKIPADSRLIESKELRTNEGILTGESLPLEKAAAILKPETIISERKNILFMGTTIESGTGKAIVFATGSETEMGKIASMASTINSEKSLEQKRLESIGENIGKVIIVIIVLALIIGVARGIGFLEIFTTVIAVALAAVPEGLPTAVTLILALSVARILSKGVLIRKMSAAETLGAISIICTDKTGTLTQGKMALTGIYGLTDKAEFENFDDLKKINKESPRFESFSLKISTLCSQAFVENPEDDSEKWVARGRPTEKALITSALNAGIKRDDLLKEQPLIAKLLFDPIHKYSASFNKISEKENIIYLLGTPELVLSQTKYLYCDGKEKKVEKSDLEKLEKLFLDLANKGQRVLASAYKKTEATKIIPYDGQALIVDDKIASDLVFVSFITLHDPLRPNIKEAISLCKKAGIRPIIVTGDHALTAKAVAESIGIPAENKNIIEGKDLINLTDADSWQNLEDISIYARVEPGQKSEIIQNFQTRGEIVAMIGDGVNDSPALKRADVGVALGSGTEVAKEASDLVLLEDNFYTLVSAINEGRAIIDNIRKIFTYLLAGSFSEVALIVFSLIIGWPLPIIASQIIWANFVVAGIINLSLAFEPSDEMSTHTPKSHSVPFINQEMKNIIVIVGVTCNLLLLGLMIYLRNYTSLPLEQTRTIIFAAISVNFLLLVFSCKGLKKNIFSANIFSNHFLTFSWIFGAAFLIMAIYLEPFNFLLKTVPLALSDWAIILSLGVLNIVIIEITKWFFVISKKSSPSPATT